MLSKISFGKQYKLADQKKFMKQAQEVTNNSTCRRAQTGAVVVNTNDEVIGRGYNVTPKGVHFPATCPRIQYNVPSGKNYSKTCRSIHAEPHAIADAGLKNCKDGTLFLAGHYHLCDPCAEWVVLADIKDVYVQHKPDSEIKHFSKKDLLNQINTNYKLDLDSL